jgi:hypothetical protein
MGFSGGFDVRKTHPCSPKARLSGPSVEEEEFHDYDLSSIGNRNLIF